MLFPALNQKAWLWLLLWNHPRPLEEVHTLAIWAQISSLQSSSCRYLSIYLYAHSVNNFSTKHYIPNDMSQYPTESPSKMF